MSRTPLFATAKKALAVASHENGVAWPRFGPDTASILSRSAAMPAPKTGQYTTLLELAVEPALHGRLQFAGIPVPTPRLHE